MTAQTRATLKTKFEQGDKPQGSDYVDLLDSFPTLVDSTAQTISSKLTVDGGVETTTVSANTVRTSSAAVDILQVSTASAAVLKANSVSAASGYYDSLRVGGKTVLGGQTSCEIYLLASSQTTITTATSYVLASGDTTARSTTKSADTTSPSAFRITYLGSDTKTFNIGCTYSVTCTTNAQILGAAIAKNGTPIESSKIERKVGTGGDVGAAAIDALESMATNDYVEFFVTNYSGANASLLKRFNMRMVEV